MAFSDVPFLGWVTKTRGISFQSAVTVVFSEIVMVSPTAIFSSPTLHPSNSFLEGAVKAHSGRVYSSPISQISDAIVPVPPFASKETLQPEIHVTVKVAEASSLSALVSPRIPAVMR